MTTFEELAETWREDASTLRKHGLGDRARALEDRAEELEEAVREWRLEELTLADAAQESGYSYSQLQHLVSEGRIPNAGREGSPRIHRRDLPRRPPDPTPGDSSGEGPQLAERVLAART